MSDKDYWSRTYRMRAMQGADSLTVAKGMGDWCRVEMEINEMVPIHIDIRSKEMAEQLHFMLGQLLGK